MFADDQSKHFTYNANCCDGRNLYGNNTDYINTKYIKTEVVDNCPWFNCRRIRFDYRCKNKKCYSNRSKSLRKLSFDEWNKKYYNL
jgi:hypothetical protein